MRVCLFGTFDTKGPFLVSLADCLKELSTEVTLVDISGTSTLPGNTGWTLVRICSKIDRSSDFASQLAEKATAEIRDLHEDRNFEAFLSCGGSNGTTIALSVMNNFPDVRKVCISTVSAFIENTNGVELIPSLVDIIDLNPVLKAVGLYAVKRLLELTENAHAAVTMYRRKIDESRGKIGKIAGNRGRNRQLWLDAAMTYLENINCSMEGREIIALTMFGNTTPCVEHCLKLLKSYGYQCLVFHAVGLSGGELMARMIENRLISGVIDITTTELADHLFGGILDAGEERFVASLQAGIPTIMSSGALDMINYPLNAIPRSRLAHPSIPWAPFHLSRTTAHDNRQMGGYFKEIYENHSTQSSLFRFVVPQTFSKLSKTGCPFHDPEADAAFVEELGQSPVVTYDGNINEKEFAKILVENFLALVSLELKSPLKLVQKLSKRPTILGAGAGSGLAARALEAGGIDLLIVYNSGYFRSHGFGSLSGLMPFANANQLTFDLGRMVLASVKRVPVFAGLCAQEPSFWVDRTLEKVQKMGFAGIQNFPTVGLVDADSHYRAGLEETGLGYDQEVKMVAKAVKMGLLTSPYVFTEKEASAMAKTGTKLMVIHLGLTMSPLGGQSGRFTVETSIPFVQSMKKVIRSISPNCLILLHGGPVNTAVDFKRISDAIGGLDGFYGASTFERNPPYDGIVEAVSRFRNSV